MNLKEIKVEEHERVWIKYKGDLEGGKKKENNIIIL